MLCIEDFVFLAVSAGGGGGGGNGGGVKWVNVNVPRYRVPGEMAQLQCNYELGNDTLYSVKWYKDNEEFFKYVPKATPKATKYRVEGVHIDVSCVV